MKEYAIGVAILILGVLVVFNTKQTYENRLDIIELQAQLIEKQAQKIIQLKQET
jgi:cell division protein FtsL